MKTRKNGKRIGTWFRLAIIGGVLVTAAYFRFSGIYPGYSPYHPDEGKAGYISSKLMLERGRPDPLDYTYPALVPIIVLAGFLGLWLPVQSLVFFLGKWEGEWLFAWQGWERVVAGLSDNVWMYWGRSSAAIISLATVGLAFVVGTKMGGRKEVGWWSALFLAVNYRAVFAGHFDLPDVYGAFFLLLAFWGLLKLNERKSWKWYGIVGVILGLAFSAKFQWFGWLPFAVWQFWESFKLEGGWGKRVKKLVSGWVVAVIGFIVTVGLVNAYEFYNFSKFYNRVLYVANHFNSLGESYFSVSGLGYLTDVVLGWGLVVFVILGLWRLGRKKEVKGVMFIVMVAGILGYYLYLVPRMAFYPRNFVNVVPFLMVFAGVGAECLRNFLCRGKLEKWGWGVFLGVLGVVLWPSVVNSVSCINAYRQPWGLSVMREWLSDNIEEASVVAAHPTERYLLLDKPGIEEKKKLKIVPLGACFCYSLSELEEEGADYALLGLDVVGESTMWWSLNRRIGITERWNRPVALARNGFVQLAARELLGFGVFAAVKPWQAMDNNYALVKLPQLAVLNRKELDRFVFDSQSDTVLWKRIDGSREWIGGLEYDEKVGYRGKGSLRIDKVDPPYPIVRWVSPVFEVESGKVYEVEGWVRSEKEIKKDERNGFLRIDFYKNWPVEWSESSLGIASNVSARYFGEGEWRRLVVKGVAPSGGKYATLSFQVSVPTGVNFWVDDLTVGQGDVDKDIGGGAGVQIEEEVLVPYLGGGF